MTEKDFAKMTKGELEKHCEEYRKRACKGSLVFAKQNSAGARQKRRIINLLNRKRYLCKEMPFYFNYILSPFNIVLIVLYRYGLNSSIGIGSLYK